jgi:hypothetical protein
MASFFGGRRDPVMLDQIAYFERRIRDRRESIRHYAASCQRDLRHGLTSPPMLLAASAVGFLAGTIKRRPTTQARPGQRARPRATTMLGSVLASIAAIRPWLPLLRRLGASLIAKSETAAREPGSRAPPAL